ncbi:hypothetical protein DIE04_17285 [Burkholderia sp. Bp8994]|uniref:hypothetical protein n=1 Tax=Burkholderia sp. Bp8994 TaxID=2184555 RepID=UPI000F59C0F4|nr:hypothetical protein [Burkholderia sp. Bp8994]RQR95305.1 hypothetical protein DIE04_17285 [Burkholderia sp. Bp8994]
MMAIIDTNVAISANGRDTHASDDCQIRCIEILEKMATKQYADAIVLDDLGLIFDEYSNYLNYSGQPGVGDIFFKFLHDNMYSQEEIRLVSITPSADARKGFDELPENEIDPSDRKFLAAAVVSGASIFNALDNDWHEKRDFLSEIKVDVVQICPEHGCVVEL